MSRRGFGVAVLIGGAAWADSRVCIPCHASIWEKYRQTGMARSFSRAGALSAAAYYHGASDTYFAMTERGGRWVEQQYQAGGANLSEKSVDFVMGSGNHARTFLSRTSRGELIELALGWYAEKGGAWAMNPGYDRADHEGFRRRIGYDCMFCHNAYPQIPAGSGPRSAPIYLSLPEGIDCQRCHGDGASHIASGGRAAIFNPRGRMDVCMQCHLETTSDPLPNAIVRYERAPFSYRPGEPLGDFVLHFDRAAQDDRFEINSSAYRLRKSQCFLKGGATCTSCHDPHGKRTKEQYEAACRQCHAPAHAETGCVGCHMPKRRTEDAVHVVMTDHFIQRRARDRVEEFAEKKHPEYRGEVVPYFPAPEIYTAIAQVAQGSNLAAGIARLRAALGKEKPAAAEYYLQLGDAAKDPAMYEEALRREPGSIAAMERLAMMRPSVEAWKRVIDRAPDEAAAWTHLGAAYLAEGRREEAVAALQKAVRLDPDLVEAYNALAAASRDSAEMLRAASEAIRIRPNDPEARYNAALALSKMRRFAEARVQLEALLRLDPDRAEGRRLLGNVLGASGDLNGAVAQFQEVVRLRPGSARANFDLGMALAESGQGSAARVYFDRAARILWPLMNADKR